jgi:hypothetical protein
MSNAKQNNILPKIQSKTKKHKQTKNIVNKPKNNQNDIISANKILKSSDNINIQNHIEKTEVKIIDEVKQNLKRIDAIKKKVYKIIFVFRNEDFYVTVKLNTLIKNMRNAICQLIGMNVKKISLMYQDVEIDESYDEKTVEEYFNLKFIKYRPIVYIKKKFILEAETSPFNIIPKNYNYKVKVQNFPISREKNFESSDSIDNIVNNFFKSYYSVNNNNNNLENIYHYKIENVLLDNNPEEEKKDQNENDNPSYIVCFSSQDIAFDFNRYINALKLVNNLFKDIKAIIIQNPKKVLKLKTNQNTVRTTIKYGIDYGLEDETDLKKRNSKLLKLVRINFLKKEQLKKVRRNNSQSNITGVGPYLSSIDKERLEEKENRKKWMSPEGFISCVGKYSGIQI